MVLTWRLARRPRLSLNARHLPWLVLTLGLLTTTLVCENQRRFNHREHVRIEHDLADAVIDPAGSAGAGGRAARRPVGA